MKTLIAVPCMDMLHTAFFVSYDSMRKVGDILLSACQSSLIYDSRNRLGKFALDAGADRILWLDSDMMLPVDLMEQLSRDLDDGLEYVSALAFQRVPPYKPIAYSKIELEKGENNTATIEVETIREWPEGLFEVAGAGLAAVMMTTDLYRRVYDEYGLPFSPLLGLGEDLSFCVRARKVGAKLYCDSRVKPKHIGLMAFDENSYLAGRRPEA